MGFMTEASWPCLQAYKTSASPSYKQHSLHECPRTSHSSSEEKLTVHKIIYQKLLMRRNRTTLTISSKLCSTGTSTVCSAIRLRRQAHHLKVIFQNQLLPLRILRLNLLVQLTTLIKKPLDIALDVPTSIDRRQWHDPSSPPSENPSVH